MEERRSGSSAAQADREIEVNLTELLLRLLEKWKGILLWAALGTALATVIAFCLIAPTYTATAKLYVLGAANSLLNVSDFQLGNYLAADYQEVFRNHEVQDAVIARLGLRDTRESLAEKITVQNPANTRILYITATSDSPESARDLANAFAAVAQQFIEEKMDSRRPSLFESAIAPDAPSAPRKTLYVAAGFFLGLLISCGWVIAQYLTDDRVRTAEEIEKYLNLPTLGMMPVTSGARRERMEKRP